MFSNVKEYFTTTQRPQIFSYNNKVYIANGKPTKLADNQCRDTRNNVSFYVGEGANFRDYKQQIMLVEELGLVYYRIFEYNEILYIIYGTGILYSNLGDNQGKDVLKFVSLRDIID